MKDTLVSNLDSIQRIDVDTPRTIAFMGDDSRVYATPFLLYDIEVVCRNLIGEHLDEQEDTVGAHVNLTHMAPTPLGMWVDISVKIVEVKGRKVELSFSCSDANDNIAEGSHIRYVVDKNKTVEHILSKKKQQHTGDSNG